MVSKKKVHGNTKYPYKPEYCEKIIKLFSPPYYKERKNPETGQVYREPEPPVFLSDFARSIGVIVGYRQLFQLWARKYPEFADSLKVIKDLEVERIRVNAELNLYNSSFSIFTLKNIAGWRDKQDIEHTFKEALYAENETRTKKDIEDESTTIATKIVEKLKGTRVSKET